jgi:membrane protease YdiL (CAAX protease family)
MKTLLSALTPLAILTLAIIISGVLGYFIFLAIDGAVPLRKLISKTALVLLLLSIFPLMHFLKLSKADLGIVAKKDFALQIIAGLVLGIAILAPLFLTFYSLDIWVVDTNFQFTTTIILAKLFKILLISFLISIPEEMLFRGILLTSLKRAKGVLFAIFLSAFYYAGLHFLKSKTEIPPDEANLSSSYYLIADALTQLTNPENLSAFIALMSVGIFLATIRIKSPMSLGICIGIHAGWVFLIKTNSAFLNRNPSSDWYFLVSNYDGVIGPLVTAWLTLITAILITYTYLRDKSTNNSLEP